MAAQPRLNSHRHPSPWRPAGRTEWRSIVLLCLLGGMALLLSWPGGSAAGLFRYERSAVAAGEWWRLFSAHFVQGNLRHWLLNVSGLALVLAIFPYYLHRPWWCGPAAILILLAFPVGAALYWFNPSLDWYVGMSGLLHGLFANHALLETFRGSRIGLIAIALLICKLVFEQTFGAAAATVTLIDLPVVTDAHLYGALAGGVLAFLPFPPRIARPDTAG